MPEVGMWPCSHGIPSMECQPCQIEALKAEIERLEAELEAAEHYVSIDEALEDASSRQILDELESRL